jgi:hypothetical protein
VVNRPHVCAHFDQQMVLSWLPFGFTMAEAEAIHFANTLLVEAWWYGLISRSKAVEIGDEIGDLIRAAHLERTRV